MGLQTHLLCSKAPEPVCLIADNSPPILKHISNVVGHADGPRGVVDVSSRGLIRSSKRGIVCRPHIQAEQGGRGLGLRLARTCTSTSSNAGTWAAATWAPRTSKAWPQLHSLRPLCRDEHYGRAKACRSCAAQLLLLLTGLIPCLPTLQQLPACVQGSCSKCDGPLARKHQKLQSCRDWVGPHDDICTSPASSPLQTHLNRLHACKPGAGEGRKQRRQRGAASARARCQGPSRQALAQALVEWSRSRDLRQESYEVR